MDEISYLNSLKLGERVVETGNNCMCGCEGIVFISNKPITKGSLCVKWDWSRRVIATLLIDVAATRLQHLCGDTRRNSMFRKESDYTDYGKGTPGYNWEIRIFMGDQRIARAFGPNVNGTNKGEFRDMDCVNAARELPDGPIADDVDVLSLLSDYHADKLRQPSA